MAESRRELLESLVKEMENVINKQAEEIRSLKSLNAKYLGGKIKEELPVNCSVCKQRYKLEEESLDTAYEPYICIKCLPSIEHPVLRHLIAETKLESGEPFISEIQQLKQSVEDIRAQLKYFKMEGPFIQMKKKKLASNTYVSAPELSETNSDGKRFTFTLADADKSMNKLKQFYLLYGRTYQTFIQWEYSEVVRHIKRGATMPLLSGLLGIKLRVVKRYVNKYDEAPGNVMTGGRGYITTQEEDRLILKLASHNASLSEIANFLEIRKDVVYARLRKARKLAEKGDLVPKVKPDVSDSDSDIDMKLEEMADKNGGFSNSEKPLKNVCRYCRLYVYVVSMNLHVTCYHKQLQPVPCTICDRGVKTEAALENHLRDAHKDSTIPPPNRIPCHHCDKTYSSKNNLKAHLTKLLGPQYNCPFCDMIFEKEIHLRRHKRIAHAERMLFKCEDCGATFLKRYLYKAHCSTHSGIKPFQCNFCNKRYSAKCYLLAHIRNQHAVPLQYGCVICGVTCNNSTSFMKHMEMHQEEEQQQLPMDVS